MTSGGYSNCIVISSPFFMTIVYSLNSCVVRDAHY